jgi:uroporphyrinogen decarboxylase
VWFMRQAGRYMACYRERRKKHGMLELCRRPDLVAETTAEAAHRLGVDAAILFSDLLLPVIPLGFTLEYAPGGPAVGPRIGGPSDLRRLRRVDVASDLGYVMEAVRRTKRALPGGLPLIGFAGAPFTLASYLIEGGSPGRCAATKSFMYRHPAAWRRLMDRLADTLREFLRLQAEAGADALQMFDSWAGVLSPEDYRRYVLPYSRKVLRGMNARGPVIHFGTETGSLLELMKDAGGSVIGVDWRVPLDEAWRRLGKTAVMGNLDPAVLLADRKTIRREVKRILDEAGGRPGHIFNLGHGVLKETPEANVRYAVQVVKELSSR